MTEHVYPRRQDAAFRVPVARTVAAASFAAFGFRIGALVAWAITGVIVARALAVEDRGVYAATVVGVTAFVSLLSGVAAAGGQAVARRGARPEAAIGAGMWVGLVAGLLCLAAGLLLSGPIPGPFGRAVLLAGAVAFAAVVRNTIATAGLARERTWVFNLGMHGPAFASLALMAVLWLTGRLGSADAALAVWAVAQWVSLVVVALLCPRWVAGALRAGGRRLLSDQARFAVLAGLTGLVTLLGARVDLLVVSVMTGSYGAGLYATASATLDILGAAGIAIAVGLYGRIGAAPSDEAARLTVSGVRLAFIAVAIPAAVLLVLAPTAIDVVFGARYVPAAAAVRVMCVAAIAWAPQTLLATYFVVHRGRAGLGLAVTAAGAFIEAALCVALIPWLGITGGAVASLVAYAITLAIFMGLFRRATGTSFATLIPVRSNDSGSDALPRGSTPC